MTDIKTFIYFLQKHWKSMSFDLSLIQNIKTTNADDFQTANASKYKNDEALKEKTQLTIKYYRIFWNIQTYFSNTI